MLGGSESSPLTAGSYSLSLPPMESSFYKFPFSSRRKERRSLPAGRHSLFIEGLNEYGNLFYQRNDPQSTLRFTTWLQQKSATRARSLFLTM